jgi:hypothetical protein
MEIQAFVSLVVPFIVVFYLAILFFMHLPRTYIQASLIGGLVAGLINMLVDLMAYYMHIWHYDLNGLVLHLPLPFYITPVLIFGSLAYLLVWRFWRGSMHWLALLFLLGAPLLGSAKDLLGWLSNSAYSLVDSLLAYPLDILMWIVMFYSGYLVFRALSPRKAFTSQAS